MKKILPRIPLLFLAAFVARGLPFEGSLTYQIDNGSEQHQISLLVKDAKLAMITPANPGGTVLIDRNAMEAIILIPRQKVYLPMPASRFVENADAQPNGSFEVTDETRRILGYTARKVIYTDAGQTTEIWMTDELGAFSPLQGPLTENLPSALLNEFPNGGMPLEMKIPDRSGVVTMRVIDIEAKSVPKSEVSIPAGFSELKAKGVPLPGVP